MDESITAMWLETFAAAGGANTEQSAALRVALECVYEIGFAAGQEHRQTERIADWHIAYQTMRAQDLSRMAPAERAVFAVAAAAHRSALLRPWPPAHVVEAAHLAAEFGYLLDAAVTLQGGAL